MATMSTEEFGVGIVCALAKEMTAATAMLDDGYEVWTRNEREDSNSYVVGQVHGHKVVITCLSAGIDGVVEAATAATHMMRTFPGIRIGLMVGLGGGIPEPEGDGIIRLGDVVVSQPDARHGGVIQHDKGKNVRDGRFIPKGFLNRPPRLLLTALSTLQAAPALTRKRLKENTSVMIHRIAEADKDSKYDFPGADRDILFCARCDRSEWTLWYWITWIVLFWLYPLWPCQLCREQRIPRSPKHADSQVHYGVIASGNVLLKNRRERDRLRVDFGAKCIEMEAAGLMNDFPCLVIRGICDYADSHKNDVWQEYAAVTAAAFAKLLLSTVSPAQIYENPRATTSIEKMQSSVPRKQMVKHFLGREDELNEITTLFDQARGKDSRPQVVVLYAMGGQGKTQIALKYCHSVREMYQAIFWINGNSIRAMVQSLVDVAKELDPKSASLHDDEARIKFAVSTLEQWKHRWLMVLDNCDDASTFSELEDKFLPYTGQGSILFTSRHRGLEELGTIIEVPPMPHRAGIQLLLHRYNGVNIDDHFTEAAEIVDRLGNLALAIDQASAFMHYTRVSINELSTFLPKYTAQREKILQYTTRNFWKYTKLDDSAKRETAVSAFTTWELSFQQLLRNTPNPDDVKHFFTLSAFFSQPAVHEFLFRLYWEESEYPSTWLAMFARPSSQPAGQEDPKQPRYDSATQPETVDLPQALEQSQSNSTRASWRPDRFWDLISKAFQLSLLYNIARKEEVYQAIFTIHPLIRDWLQLRLVLEQRQAYTREATILLCCSIRICNNRGGNAQARMSILSHIDAVLVCDTEFFGDRDRLGRDISTLSAASWIASFFDEQGKYSEAEALYQQITATKARILGPEHADTLASKNNFAIVLRLLGKHCEAEAVHRQVTTTTERILGPEHPDTLASKNNLAIVLRPLGKYREAETIHQQVTTATERILGPEHPDTLASKNNLALVLRLLGKYREAEAVHQQVTAAIDRVLGPEHPDTLASKSNLAIVLACLGKYSEAEVTYRQVIVVKERVLGSEHPDTLLSKNGLASVLFDLGKYSEAGEIHQQVIDVRERTLGPKHPDTLLTRSKLASVFRELGQHREAEAIYQQVIAMQERVLGLEHLDTLLSKENFALGLRHLGKHGEAMVMYQQVIAVFERVLGPEHPNTISSKNNLASVLSDLGMHSEAEAIHQQIMPVMERVLGPEHPDTLLSKNNLALVLFLLGKHSEAEKTQLQVVRASFVVFKPQHHKFKGFRNNLEHMWECQGREESQIRSMSEDLLRELSELHSPSSDGMMLIQRPTLM